MRDGRFELRHDIVRARRLRLRELLGEHRTLSHGGVIACLGGVELGLGSRKLLLGSRALGFKFRPPAIDLRLSARKIASARVEGRLRARELRGRVVKLRLRVVKFRLRIVELLERIGSLGLEVGTALVKFRLCIGANPVETRSKQIIRNAVNARSRRIDKRLVIVGRPLHLTSTSDGNERLGIGEILREGAFGNISEGCELPRPERR